MDLRQENKSGTLKYILLCVFAGLILAVGAAIRTVYSANQPVIFEHDKLYKQYKDSNPNDFAVLPSTSDDGLTVLAENDKYSVNYSFDYDNGASFPYLQIKRKSDGKTFPIYELGWAVLHKDDGSSLYLRTGSKHFGYYDPYTQEFEDHIWVEKADENSLVLKLFVAERLCLSEKHLPNVLTKEDYDTLYSAAEENTELYETNIFNSYKQVTKALASDEDKTLNWNLLSAAKESVFEDGFYMLRTLSTQGAYRPADETFEALGVSTESKCRMESKILKDGYEAYMAMLTLTFDISGEYPVVSYDLKMISPREYNVESVTTTIDDLNVNRKLQTTFFE